MRCKPGDLAIYVGIDTRDIGRIVRVIRWHCGNEAWAVDPKLSEFFFPDGRWSSGRYAADSSLRPISPSEGQDETLTRAPIKHTEKA